MNVGQTKISPRNLWIDTLRGFASVYVVFFHLNEVTTLGNPAYKLLASLGYLGVPVFFIISGYCVWASILRAQSAKKFVWRRLLRIYPPYLASLLVVIAACIIRKLLAGQNDITQFPHSLMSWLATLTLTTAPVSSVGTINWVYWSLSYEIFFYLVIAVGMTKQGYRLWLIYVLLGLSLAPNLPISSYLFFLDSFGLFSAGIGLSMITQRANFSAYAVITLSMASIAVNSSLPAQIVFCLTSLTIWISDHQKTWLNSKNVFTDLGLVSYSLYLLHVPIGNYLLIRFRQGIWLDHLPLHVMYDVAVTGICIFCAFVFYKYVEKPSIAWGRTANSYLSRKVLSHE
ncbi:MAG: acyltransferase [Phormidesmis sp.]